MNLVASLHALGARERADDEREPPMRTMYTACVDTLALASQLSSAPGIPSPEILQARVRVLLEQMARKCADGGIAEEDVVDARYALAAFTDEQIFRRSEWPGKAEWMSNPLQLVYFNENSAGDGFFVRAQALLAQPQRAHVLQIYSLCLALGFQGRFAVHEREGLAAVARDVTERVRIAFPHDEKLSPRAKPKRKGGVPARSEIPLWAIGLACFLLAAIVFAFCKWVVFDGKT